MTTVTLADIQSRDLTVDEIRPLITEFACRRKYRDVELKDLDNEVVYKHFWWVLRYMRNLDFTGKLDTTKYTVQMGIAMKPVADSKKNQLTLTVKIVDAKGKIAYTFFWDNGYASVADADGKILAEGSYRKDVRPLFARPKPVKVKKEKPLKQAAAPTKKTKGGKKPAVKGAKKTPAKAKKEKRVKAVKNPVPAAAPETDVLSEVETALAESNAPAADPEVFEEDPPAELG